MSQGSRHDRVGDLVRNELSVQLTRYVRDPGVRHVTVTHVRMSKDLEQARVFYIVPADEDAQTKRDASRALRRARPFLRRRMAARLQLRRVPDLTFEYDDSAEQADRIAYLFEQINQARQPDVDD